MDWMAEPAILAKPASAWSTTSAAQLARPTYSKSSSARRHDWLAALVNPDGYR